VNLAEGLSYSALNPRPVNSSGRQFSGIVRTTLSGTPNGSLDPIFRGTLTFEPGRDHLFFFVATPKFVIFCRALTDLHLGHLFRAVLCSLIPKDTVKEWPHPSHL
jgi:hypothetical protein